MPRVTTIVRKPAVKADRVVDIITLDHEARNRRHGRLQAEGGTEIHLDLDMETTINDGDALRLEDGRLVQVKAAAESLLEVKAENPLRLTRLARPWPNWCEGRAAPQPRSSAPSSRSAAPMSAITTTGITTTIMTMATAIAKATPTATLTPTAMSTAMRTTTMSIMTMAISTTIITSTAMIAAAAITTGTSTTTNRS